MMNTSHKTFMAAGLFALLSSSALAQSSGIAWKNGNVLTAQQLQQLDNAKMNISSLGKPGFAPKLNDQGQITNPVVGDVSRATATPDGKTVSQIGQMAVGSVQQTDANQPNGYAKLDGSGNVTVPVTGSVAAATANDAGDTVSSISDIAKSALQTATNAIPKSDINVKNGVAPLDGNGNITNPVNGDTSQSTALSTGSNTTRTLADRFSDIVNVKDFGAKGDGAADDTTSVQQSINYACSKSGSSSPFGSGGLVFLPSGVYNISSVKFPCNGITIKGSNNGNTNSGSLDYRGTVIHLTTPANTSAFVAGMTTSDYGGGIHLKDFSIDGSDMTPSSTAIDFSWLQHSSVSNISTYHIQNFYREQGGASNVISNVSLFQFRGTGIEFFGGPCTGSLSACNTRADLLRVDHVDMTTDNTTKDSSGNLEYYHKTTCFSYHGLAQSLDVNTSVCESAKFGINAYCDTTAGNNGEACPAFARFYDFEAEDCITCVNASDVQDWEFTSGYYLGAGTDSSHVINLYSTNYGGNWSSTTQGSYTQAVRFNGGRFGNAGGSVMYIGLSQVDVHDAQIFSSNLSDTNKTIGAPNIEVNGVGSATTPTQVNIHDNILCTASGQQPVGLFQGGVWLQDGVTNSHVANNLTSACSGSTAVGKIGISDNSGNTSNLVINNQ